MADGGAQQAVRYSAFISYSHRDAVFARGLHRRLENYRLPRRLREPNSARVGPGRRLNPIFLDIGELPAAVDLPEAVQQALAASSCLIVVATPNSAKSRWVGREIELFRALHGDGTVLAALFEGSSAEALHPALKIPGPDGRPLQPLAADFRTGSEGRRLALLKLMAVLADVPLDALVQRDAQRRVRRITWISAGAFAGMAIAATLAVVAIEARAQAERDRARGEAVIDRMLNDLRAKLKATGRLDVLDALNRAALLFYQGQDLARLPESELLERAKLLQAIGEDDEKRGDFQSAQTQFEEARRTTATLLVAHPNDQARIFAHAQSEYWMAFISWRVGDYEKAKAGFDAYALFAQRLTKIAPDNTDWLMERGYANINRGMFALRRSIDLARAEPYLTAALTDFEAAAQRRPSDADIQSQIADTYAWLGDLERLRGDYDKALADREAQHRILDGLFARDPRNVETRADLIANELAVARIDASRGDFATAIDKLSHGHQAALDLANGVPDNMDMAKQVRIFELFEVQNWLNMTVSVRPSDAIVVAALGDCTNDRATLKSAELATFCGVLQARHLAEAGDASGARRLLTSLDLDQRGDRLTERWGLNLADDIKFIPTAGQSKEASQ